MKYSQPKRSFRFQGHAENVLLLCLKQQHIKLQLIGQLLSALCPAAGKNLAAVSIGHSFAEAMLHLPMPFFGWYVLFIIFLPPFHRGILLHFLANGFSAGKIQYSLLCNLAEIHYISDLLALSIFFCRKPFYFSLSFHNPSERLLKTTPFCDRIK